MPSIPLVDVGVFKTAAFRELDSGADEELQRCLEAATEELEGDLGRPELVNQGLDITEWHDGSKASGRNHNILYLRRYPIVSITSVKENGTVLTVGRGYDATNTFQVLQDPSEGRLVRIPAGTDRNLVEPALSLNGRPWAGGLQNIEVTYQGGYTEGVDVPAQLAQICIELAALIYESAPRMGRAGDNPPSGGSSYITQLPDRSRRALRQFAGWYRRRSWS